MWDRITALCVWLFLSMLTMLFAQLCNDAGHEGVGFFFCLIGGGAATWITWEVYERL